jgi:hypothetical protein
MVTNVLADIEGAAIMTNVMVVKMSITLVIFENAAHRAVKTELDRKS